MFFCRYVQFSGYFCLRSFCTVIRRVLPWLRGPWNLLFLGLGSNLDLAVFNSHLSPTCNSIGAWIAVQTTKIYNHDSFVSLLAPEWSGFQINLEGERIGSNPRNKVFFSQLNSGLVCNCCRCSASAAFALSLILAPALLLLLVMDVSVGYSDLTTLFSALSILLAMRGSA